MEMNWKVKEVRKTLKKKEGEEDEIKYKHKLEPSDPGKEDLRLKKASVTTLEGKAFSINDIVCMELKNKQTKLGEDQEDES